MDDLSPIIDRIAELASQTESDKWLLAEAIHDAFIEVPAYTEGLLSGLMERTKYTSTTIYNLRNAWELKDKFNSKAPALSVSHYSRMYNLITKYKLDGSEIVDSLLTAEQENMSVADMAIMVSEGHEPDPNGKHLKDITRFITLGRRILNDPNNRMEKPLYANLYDVIKELEKHTPRV